MAITRLQTRFTLAGSVLVLATVFCGVWSVSTLLKVSAVVHTAARESSVPAMAEIDARVRREAIRAAWVVAGISAAALLISSLVAVHLTRRVVGPINVLAAFADSIRFGDFRRRVQVESPDELGRLAAGLNRMAEALEELQRFNLAQVLETKWTLEATLEALPDAVFLLDTDERIVSMNRTARQIFGLNGKSRESRLSDLPLTESVGRAVREALKGMTPATPRSDLREAVSAEVEGTAIKLLPWVVPVPNLQNQTHGAVLALYDVTGFAKLDELRMEMIAVASHELKNPLTTLRMNILMLQETASELSDRQRLMLGAAISGCEELAKTIDEFLDLARADAGQLHLVLERLDLCVLVDHAVQPLRQRFEEAGIDLQIAKEVPQAICRGDAKRLTMVLANLLANSVKYTPAGGRVVVRVSSMQNAGVRYGPTLRIAVTDTGPGVPPEYRERIFEKFFRVEHQRAKPKDAEKTPEKEVRGAGVGLYLCKHIIDAHGGNIWCEAGDGGRGTTIATTLPGEQ
jgi:NtrC-family two-component system sensor histidine kinase KinB